MYIHKKPKTLETKIIRNLYNQKTEVGQKKDENPVQFPTRHVFLMNSETNVER